MKQFEACDEGDNKCKELGYQERDVYFENCTEEITGELSTYYITRNTAQGGFAKTAQCVNDDSLYIRGDPFAWNTAATL